MKILFSAPAMDDFINLLRAWRFWMLGAFIGVLAGSAFYFVKPPEYRARATVVVSFNMEKAWQNKPDNELFYYLERESRKLEEVAWADATLQQVADETGFTVSTLRSGKLELSQPQDGGWHFYANDPSAGLAQKLASAWAGAFTSQIRQGIQNAVALDAARKTLETSPTDPQYLARVSELEASSLAITPELQVSLAQGKNLPVARASELGSHMFAGAGIGLALSALFALFFIHPGHKG